MILRRQFPTLRAGGLALLLLSGPAFAQTPAPRAPRLPFPPPLAVTVSDQTRYSSGVVTAVDPSGKKFDLRTAAGTLVCQFAEWSRVMGSDGKPAVPATVKVGSAVRVYYVTGHGAQLQEVDLLATH